MIPFWLVRLSTPWYLYVPNTSQSHAAKSIKSTVEDDNYHCLQARLILHVGRGWSRDWLVPCDIGAGGARVVARVLLVHVALLVVEAEVARVRARTLLHAVYRSYLRQFDITWNSKSLNCEFNSLKKNWFVFKMVLWSSEGFKPPNCVLKTGQWDLRYLSKKLSQVHSFVLKIMR